MAQEENNRPEDAPQDLPQEERPRPESEDDAASVPAESLADHFQPPVVEAADFLGLDAELEELSQRIADEPRPASPGVGVASSWILSEVEAAFEEPQPAPEPMQVEPEAVQPAPEPMQAAPEAVQPAPEQMRFAPQAPPPEPELMQPEPEAMPPEPEAVQPALEQMRFAPQAPPPEPELMQPEPEAMPPEPQAVQPAPEQMRFAPQAPQPEPEVMQPEPEVMQPEPEVMQPEPEAMQPESLAMEPESLAMQPEPEAMQYAEELMQPLDSDVHEQPVEETSPYQLEFVHTPPLNEDGGPAAGSEATQSSEHGGLPVDHSPGAAFAPGPDELPAAHGSGASPEPEAPAAGQQPGDGWLMDLDGDSASAGFPPAPRPAEFEQGSRETSYYEPEPTSRMVGRVALRAAIALVTSMGAMGVYKFTRNSLGDATEVYSPLVHEQLEPSGGSQLVQPEGGSTAGGPDDGVRRMINRDGTSVAVDSPNARSGERENHAEPGELSVRGESPVASADHQDALAVLDHLDALIGEGPLASDPALIALDGVASEPDVSDEPTPLRGLDEVLMGPGGAYIAPVWSEHLAHVTADHEEGLSGLSLSTGSVDPLSAYSMDRGSWFSAEDTPMLEVVEEHLADAEAVEPPPVLDPSTDRWHEYSPDPLEGWNREDREVALSPGSNGIGVVGRGVGGTRLAPTRASVLDLYEQWMISGAQPQLEPSERLGLLGRSPSMPAGAELPFFPWLEAEEPMVASTDPGPDPDAVVEPLVEPAVEPAVEPVVEPVVEPDLVAAAEQPAEPDSAVESEGGEVEEQMPDVVALEEGTPDEVVEEQQYVQGESAVRRAPTDGRWAWTRIPGPEVIEGDVVIRTPRVGRVRVIFHSGEVFEGRLFSVGGGSVAVETNLGRVAFETPAVETIRPQMGPGVGQINGKPSVAGLPKVRVQVAGGWIEGHELARQEGRIVLVDERGYRISLESDEITTARGGRPLIEVKGRRATPPSQDR